MAFLISFVFSFVLICLEQTLAREPEFPKIPDDFTATGFLRYENINLNFHFTLSVSKSLRASLTDAKAYGVREKTLKLEKYGSHGAHIRFGMRFGRTICYLVKGTSKEPVNYVPYFLQNLKYVGTEKVDGLEMQRWKFSTAQESGTLLIREDKSGPFIHRVDTDNVGTMTFETFTASPPSPSVFKFDTSGCKKINPSNKLEYFKKYLLKY